MMPGEVVVAALLLRAGTASAQARMHARRKCRRGASKRFRKAKEFVETRAEV